MVEISVNVIRVAVENRRTAIKKAKNKNRFDVTLISINYSYIFQFTDQYTRVIEVK